jgi:RND family efflux transporter MFP subunit
MTEHMSVNLRWSVLVAAAAGLLAAGAAGTYLVWRSSAIGDHSKTATSTLPASASAAPTPQGTSESSLPDVVITLSQEAVGRAGITVAPVGTGRVGGDLRLPGVVEPNAYRQVIVTPLLSGRITRVFVELGQHVREGQTMAQIFSPELAEAHTRYVSARAALDAHDRELQRTQKLVEIGAASRSELERIHAEHSAQTSEVQSLRARLELLGVPPAAIDSGGDGSSGAVTSVPAPIAGVVTERLANVGLNVDPASKLFTVVDLSTVWVVASVHEKDFSRVQVGSRTTITTTAYPDLPMQGRVSYADPQVNAETRTAKVRVEVPNARNLLRLGMYADVVATGADTAIVPVIPRSAVQDVGDRKVVYLASPTEPDKFTERQVRLGQTSSAQVEVLSGVGPGDVIVTEGSFFVRAERERLGLRTRPAAAPSGRAASDDVQTANIIVGDTAFEPSRVTLSAGVRARVTFIRTSDKTCATEVLFPSLAIKRTLPLNQPVVIELTPSSGELAFTCGMNMLRGTIVAR